MLPLLRSEIINRINQVFALVNSFISDNKRVKCCICGWQGRAFMDLHTGYKNVYRESTCPKCWSQPRHRTIYLYLKRTLTTSTPLQVLHFSPEWHIAQLVSSYSNVDYLSVDIDKKLAMQREDIMNLSFDDGSFDIIICIHVLEHVEDDRKAMSELYRILKKKGFALIDVPIDINRQETYENSSITTPEERAKEYWQWDHMRLYGRDFPDRLRDAGFIVFYIKVEDFVKYNGEWHIERLGLSDAPFYICRR